MTGQPTQKDARTGAQEALLATEPARKRGSANDYTDAERVSGALIAAIIGPRKAAHRLDVPERTIYDWLSKFGGPAALRDGTRDALAAHQYGVALLACEALVRKMEADEAPFEQLLEVVRILGVAGAKPIKEGESAAPVLFQINVGDGKAPEVFDIPREDPRAHPTAAD